MTMALILRSFRCHRGSLISLGDSPKTLIQVSRDYRIPKQHTVNTMSQENIIYIGRKPVMAYCLAVMTSLKDAQAEVILMARGRAISKAVDVAEVVRNQFISDLSVKEISIGTEQLETEDGSPRNISNISIVLAKD